MFGINELSWTPFPASILFNATQKTFKAEVADIPASPGKQTNEVRWYSSTNSYGTSWGSTGGFTSTCTNTCDTVAKYLDTTIVKQALDDGQGFRFTSTCTNTCDTVAKYLDNSMVKQALADGQGFTFISIGPNDTWEDGTTDDHKCPDTNRKTHEDGGCDNECKDGYEFKEGYVAGMDFFEPGQCVKIQADPNDCATANRTVKDDKTCGDCLSGYAENDAGDCVAEEEEKETNWLMWGGIAVVAVIGYSIMS